MRGWGILFVIFGVAAFFLPKIGMQVFTVGVFGAYWKEAAIGHILFGVALIVAAYMRQRGNAPSQIDGDDRDPSA